MKCPYCKEQVETADLVFRNCETYHNDIFKLACDKCNRPIIVCCKRTIEVVSIKKGKHTITDWGEETKI